jgi:hypothetical protein
MKHSCNSKTNLMNYLLLILFTSCASQEVNNDTALKNWNDSIKSIHINSDVILEEYDPTEIISQIDYVHLELREDNIIGQIDKVIKFDQKIFVLDRTKAKGVFCFGADGKYLFKIGEFGRGPGEYRELEDIVIDQNAQEIGLLARSEILWYNIKDGSFTGSRTRFKEMLIERVNYLDPTSLIGHANNQCGGKNNCYNFYRFNKEGKILNKYLPIDKNEKDLFIEYENPFSGDLIAESLTHLYNDTIYGISSNDGLYDKYHIDFGDMALKDRSLLPRKTKDLVKWLSTSDEKGLASGIKFFAETDSVMIFNFLNGMELVTTIYSKYSGKSISANSLSSPGSAVGGINVGVHNNQFITSISGEILMAIQVALETHEKKDEIKNALSKELYDRAVSIKGSANPTLIFTKFRSF